MSFDEVELGYVSGVFGVKGEVRLHIHNRDSKLLSKPRTVTLVSKDGTRRSVELRARSGAGKRVLGSVSQVTDPDQARALIGWTIVVPADVLPPPASDEFYLHQVIGLAAVVNDVDVGKIVDVHVNGPVDLFEVAIGEDVQFVPAVKENILEIVLSDGKVLFSEEALEL